MEYYKNVEKKDGRVLLTGGPRDIQRKQRMERDHSQIIDLLKEQISSLQSQINNSPPTTGFSAEQIDNEIRKAVKEAVIETKARYEGPLKEAIGKETAMTEKFNNADKINSEKLNKEIEKYKEVYNKKEYELEERYNNVISKLEDQLKLVEEKLTIKDELIGTLHKEKDSAIRDLIEEQNKKMEELTKSMAYNQLPIEEDPDRPKMEEVFVDPLEEDAGKDLTPYIDIEEDSIEEKEAMKDKVDKLRKIMGDRKK